VSGSFDTTVRLWNLSSTEQDRAARYQKSEERQAKR